MSMEIHIKREKLSENRVSDKIKSESLLVMSYDFWRNASEELSVCIKWVVDCNIVD